MNGHWTVLPVEGRDVTHFYGAGSHPTYRLFICGKPVSPGWFAKNIGDPLRDEPDDV